MNCLRCDKPLVGRQQKKFCSPACAIRTATENREPRTGRANNRYNGGLCRRSDGRWVINCRDGSLLLYSRAVMAAHIGRLLRPDELVHHRNEIVDDDRVENLEIVTRAQHLLMHFPALLAARHAKGLR